MPEPTDTQTGNETEDKPVTFTQTQVNSYVAAERRRVKAEYEGKIADLEARIPAEGAVVLSRADGARWEALKALGKPEDLQAALTERDTLKQQVEVNQRKETIRTAAAIRTTASPQGYDADVLGELPNLPPIEVSGEGDARKAEVVTDSGKVALDEYVSQRYAKFLPALQPQQQSQQQRSVPFVQQPRGGDKPQTKEQIAVQETERLQGSGKYSGF